MLSHDLPAVEAKILAELARKPECFVTHPKEVHVLQRLTSDEMGEFARGNGWRVIRRVGGKQFQFYNDTFARMNAESASR